MSRAFTTEELAQRWNMTPSTLHQWRRHKKGPTFKKEGKNYMYYLEDVEKYECANWTVKINPDSTKYY